MGHVLTKDDQVHIPEYNLKTLTSSQTHARYSGAIIAMKTTHGGRPEPPADRSLLVRRPGPRHPPALLTPQLHRAEGGLGLRGRIALKAAIAGARNAPAPGGAPPPLSCFLGGSPRGSPSRGKDAREEQFVRRRGGRGRPDLRAPAGPRPAPCSPVPATQAGAPRKCMIRCSRIAFVCRGGWVSRTGVGEDAQRPVSGENEGG